MSEIAKLFVALGADISGYMAGLDKAGKQATSFADIFKGSLAADLVADGLRSAMSAVSAFMGEALNHLGEVEQINAQTAAAIRSTGGAAGATAAQISDMANAIEAATGVSGEMIQRGENLLLTFTNVKNAAGQGNDVFNQTTKIMADMSVALGQDASASAMQLGKALNDPIKGVTALQRVGVSFTESQKASIESMVKHGKTLEAQKLILGELNKEFGGSAEAFGRTWPGVLAKAEAAWENLGDSLLGPLMPAFKAGMSSLADVVNELSNTIGSQGLLTTLHKAFGPDVEALIIGIGAAVTMAVIPSILATLPALAAQASAFTMSAAAALVAYAPVILTGTAVALVANMVIKHWSEIPGAFSAYMSLAESTLLSWYQSARLVVINTVTAFQSLGQNIAGTFNSVFGGVAQMMGKAFNALPAEVRGPIEGVASAFSGMVVQVTTAAAAIPGAIAGQVQKVSASVAEIGGAIGQELEVPFNQARATVAGFMAHVNKFSGETVDAFHKAGDAGDAMGEKVKKGAGKAKKGADDAKAAAAQAKRACEDIAAGLHGLVGLMSLAGIPTTLKAMGAALDGVAKHSETAAAGFDEYGARAAVLAATLDRLKAQGLKETAGLFVQLTKEKDKAAAASTRFQEREKALGDTFETLSAGMRENAATAAVMGAEFNQLDADIKLVERALIANMAATTPNAEAVAFLTAQLAALRAQVPPAVSGFQEFKTNMEGTAQAASLMREGLATISEALGATFMEPLLAGVQHAMDFGLAIVQVAAAAPAVADGVGKIGIAMNTALGPIGWIAIGVAGVTAALYALGQESGDSMAKYDADIVEAAKKTVDTSNVMTRAWDGFAGFVMNVARNVNKAFRSMFAPSADAQRQIDEAAASMQAARDKATKLADGFLSIHKAVSSGLGSSLTSALKGFFDGSKSIAETLRTGVRDAVVNGIIEATVQKGVIEGAFGSLFENLSIAIRDGDTRATDNLISQIGSKVPQVAKQLEGILGSVKTTLDRAFSDSGGQIDKIMATRNKAFGDAFWKKNTLGSIDEAGMLRERISATEKALADLRSMGDIKALGGGGGMDNVMSGLLSELTRTRAMLDSLADVAKAVETKGGAAKAEGDLEKAFKAIDDGYAGMLTGLHAKLTQIANTGGVGSAEGQAILRQIQGAQAEVERLKGEARGGSGTQVNITMNVSNKDAGRELVKQLSRVGVVAT